MLVTFRRLVPRLLNSTSLLSLAYLLAVDPFITMTYSPPKAAVGNSDVGINWRKVTRWD